LPTGWRVIKKIRMGGGADRSLDGVLGEHGAVELHGREVQVRRDLRVLDLDGVVERHALDPLGRDRRGGDRRPTPERLRARVPHQAVVTRGADGAAQVLAVCTGFGGKSGG